MTCVAFGWKNPGIFFSINAEIYGGNSIRHGQHCETNLGIGEPGGAGALGGNFEASKAFDR